MSNVALLQQLNLPTTDANMMQKYIDQMTKQINQQMNQMIMQKMVTTQSTTTMNTFFINGTGTNSTSSIPSTIPSHKVYWHQLNDAYENEAALASGNIKIRSGRATVIEMPDGGVIQVHADGSYEFIRDNVKVRYKANPVRDFNRYINASDLLEEFIDFVDDVGSIDKRGFLDLPIELFIKWLVVRAAEADGEAVDDDKASLRAELAPQPPVALLAAPAPKTGHCKCCGKFITNRRRDASAFFCSSEHFDAYLEKSAL